MKIELKTSRDVKRQTLVYVTDVRRRRRKRSVTRRYVQPPLFPEARDSPVLRCSIKTRTNETYEIELRIACHSSLTPCLKYMQSMRKVHESLTPPPPLLPPLLCLSYSLPPVDASLSISLRLLRPLFLFPVFSSAIHLPSLHLFLLCCNCRSALLSRLFNPSTLRSIATLLYLLLTQSLCSLVERSSLLLVFEKALPYHQGRVTSNSRCVQR